MSDLIESDSPLKSIEVLADRIRTTQHGQQGGKTAGPGNAATLIPIPLSAGEGVRRAREYPAHKLWLLVTLQVIRALGWNSNPLKSLCSSFAPFVRYTRPGLSMISSCTKEVKSCLLADVGLKEKYKLGVVA